MSVELQVVLAIVGPLVAALATASTVGIFRMVNEMRQWKGEMITFRDYVEAELRYNKRAHDKIRKDMHDLVRRERSEQTAQRLHPVQR